MRRQLPAHDSRLSYSILYKGRVVDTHDPLNLGRVKVLISELEHEEPIWALPIHYSQAVFGIPELNSTVYVIFDLESPNTCYYIGMIPEFTDISTLKLDEHTLFIPEYANTYTSELFDNLVRLDAHQQERYYIQHRSVYSSEFWYRIPSYMAYNKYSEHLFLDSSLQPLNEAKVVRVRQSSSIFMSTDKLSAYVQYILPGANTYNYNDDLNVFTQNKQDDEAYYKLYVASWNCARKYETLKYVQFDNDLLNTHNTLHEHTISTCENTYTNELFVETKIINSDVIMNTNELISHTTAQLSHTITHTLQTSSVVNAIQEHFQITSSAIARENILDFNGQNNVNEQYYLSTSQIVYNLTEITASGATYSEIRTLTNGVVFQQQLQGGQNIRITYNSLTGTITIQADSQYDLTSPNITFNGTTFTVNAPTITLNGNVNITGTLTVNGLSTLAGGATTQGVIVVDLDNFVNTYNVHVHGTSPPPTPTY